MVFSQRFKSYLIFHFVVVLLRCLVCHLLITAFSLLSTYYNVEHCFVWHFICVGLTQTSEGDSISRRYQIMIVSILKKLSHRYSSHYIIKFVGFMSFIMLLTWILYHTLCFLTICILDLSIYYKFESIKSFFL